MIVELMPALAVIVLAAAAALDTDGLGVVVGVTADVLGFAAHAAWWRFHAIRAL